MPAPDPLKDILPPVTADDLRLLSSDLSELQDIVNRGDFVVLAGGPVIAWWGFCIFLGSGYNGLIEFGAPVIPIGPLEALFGYLGSMLITRTMKTHKILKPWRNQAITSAWWMLAIVIPIFIVGCYARGHGDLFIISGFECLAFAMVTGFSAMASLRRWLLWPAAGWVLSAIIILFFVDELWRCIVFALSSLVLLTIPGVYLTIQYRNGHR